MLPTLISLLKRIEIKKPLILNITNAVTMDFVANGLLSLGASPMMSQAENEMAELMMLADAITINLGTLDERFVLLCDQVCEIANRFNKPVVLDPAGAGATQYRTDAACYLLSKHRIAIVRANASETLSLAGEKIISKGVDSTVASDIAVVSAKSVSQKFETIVVVSGAIDYIASGEYHESFALGSSLMTRVTGVGCLFSAVIACFHAVETEGISAARHAIQFYGICGREAAKKSTGPGSFRVNFIDELGRI